MLKRIVLAAVIIGGVPWTWIAFADGLSERYIPPLHNWSGLYVGAHVGWERGVVEGTTCDPTIITGFPGCMPSGNSGGQPQPSCGGSDGGALADRR